MFIHNTTFSIEESVLQDCISKLKSGYITELKESNKFENIVFSEVLIQNEPNMRTYSLQIFCSNINTLKVLKLKYQAKLEAIVLPYMGKVLFFQSKMRVID
jgi:hypothetical protein